MILTRSLALDYVVWYYIHLTKMEIGSVVHNIGTILGFGGAVISAVLMLRLRTDAQRLRRGRIARRIALITWCGFSLLILSGVKLTLDYPSGYTLIFGVKHLCVVILLVDALFIHFKLLKYNNLPITSFINVCVFLIMS